MIQLKTRWAEGITAENVQQEYPRPMLVRDSFFNLNGEWEYGISQSAEIEKYDGSILVPFSPETMLSGVQKLGQISCGTADQKPDQTGSQHGI